MSIERLDGGVLELDGWGLASTFFTTDPSSVGIGSYDSLCGKTRADEIEIADVEALNRTMRARTAHDRWAPLIDTPLPRQMSREGDAEAQETPANEEGPGDGAYRDRTGDLRLAKPALSQLS
jgi:hypothetical protein